jgi:hypothetical protein
MFCPRTMMSTSGSNGPAPGARRVAPADSRNCAINSVGVTRAAR